MIITYIMYILHISLIISIYNIIGLLWITFKLYQEDPMEFSLKEVYNTNKPIICFSFIPICNIIPMLIISIFIEIYIETKIKAKRVEHKIIAAKLIGLNEVNLNFNTGLYSHIDILNYSYLQIICYHLDKLGYNVQICDEEIIIFLR